MKLNIKQRNVKIIAEIHPQHLGSIKEVERMILQCKIGGADYVKVQLYSSKKLFNNILSKSELNFSPLFLTKKKLIGAMKQILIYSRLQAGLLKTKSYARK